MTRIEIKIPKEVQDYHKMIFFSLNTRQFRLNIWQHIETELGNPAATRRTVKSILKAISQLE